MKQTQSQKPVAKTAEKEAEKVTVTQKTKQAIIACFTQDSAVQQAQEGQQKKWLECGLVLNKEYGDKEKAREALKAVFAENDRDPKELKWSSYISKILVLGFPVDEKAEEARDLAVKDGLPTGKLLEVVRGKLKRTKAGAWVKKAANGTGNGAGGGSGGHNRTAPIDGFEKAQTQAFTAANTAKLKNAAIGRILATAILASDELDMEEIIEAMQAEQEKQAKE